MPWQLAAEPPKKPKPQPREKEPRLPKEFERFARVASYTIPPASPAEIAFRHTAWAARRGKVRAALCRTGIRDFALNRFDECGSCCSVEWSETLQKHRVRANYCRCRHCEPCMRAKANRLAANLKARLMQEPAGRYRFITLTLRHSDAPLRDQIRRLYASFRKLRHSKTWKLTQRGGALALEVKWQASTRRWHPHLHVISEGDFLDKDRLSTAWHAATGDSFVIDIRMLHDAKEAAFYVAKYVTKGTSADVWNDTTAATEWIISTKGVRVCATFGTWRGYKLTAMPQDATDWVPVATLNSLHERAAAGEEHARRLLLLIRPPGMLDSP